MKCGAGIPEFRVPYIVFLGREIPMGEKTALRTRDHWLGRYRHGRTSDGSVAHLHSIRIGAFAEGRGVGIDWVRVSRTRTGIERAIRTRFFGLLELTARKNPPIGENGDSISKTAPPVPKSRNVQIRQKY